MKKTVVAALAATTLLSSCVGTGSLLGDIRVAWSFKDAASCEEAGVVSVDIQIVGADTGTREFEQPFDCRDGVVTILDFLPGTYDVTLYGLDYSGIVRYQAVLQTEVKPGTTELTAVLDFVLGNISFDWSFDGVTDCMAAGVTSVQVVVYDSAEQTAFNEYLECKEGGVTVYDFMRGPYTLVLYGLDVAGERLFSASVPIMVEVGDNQYGTIDLHSSATTGSITVSWSFDGGKGCTEAGVKTVKVVLAAPGGKVMKDEFPACALGSHTIPDLDPGYYKLGLTGLDPGDSPLYAINPVDIEVVIGSNDLGTFDLSRL